MPHALRIPTAHGSCALSEAAAALAPVLSGMVREARAFAWQDGLDLLATIAGLKPLCLVGRGFHERGWTAALLHVAVTASLSVLEAAPWFPEAEPDFFPDWYVAASARRSAAPVTYICRDDATRLRAASLSSRGRVSDADEAAMLGYPLCCVAQHHQRTLAFERIVIEMVQRVTQGDRERMARLVEAGTEPLPATQEEWQRHANFTAITPSPSTSVNMCDACAADRMSPAASLSRRYADLAAASGYPTDLTHA